MEASHHQNDIPIWFNGTQRWMTGLTKRTTCDDVIYALLYSTGLHETESTDNYAIFEKWREVERPLSARTKIVKVWVFWGEEQPNVQLNMRSLDDYFLPGESSLYLRSRRRHKKSSRHKSRHTGQCRCHNKRGCTECSRLRTLEQLVKLVVSQERKIQGLGDRIYDTDKLIDKHEARIHQHRVQQNGMDYVQNSYLNSHSSESSSSLDGSSFSTLDIKDLQVIFPESSFQELEEIACICNDVTHVERRLEEELAKIRDMTPEVEHLAEKLGLVTEATGETNQELEDTRVDMIRAVTAHVTNEYNEREVDRKMESCVASLAYKAEFLRDIQDQLFELEKRLGCDSADGNDIEVMFSQNSESVISTGQPTHHPVHDTMDTNSKSQPWSCPAVHHLENSSQNHRPFERGKTCDFSDIYKDELPSSEQSHQVGSQFSHRENNMKYLSAISLDRDLNLITPDDTVVNSQDNANDFVSGNRMFHSHNNYMKSQSTGNMGEYSRHTSNTINNTPSVHFNKDIQYYPSNCAIQEPSRLHAAEQSSENIGRKMFSGAFTRESRPGRKGRDSQTSGSFQRSRSADRYSSRHRERSLDAFERMSKHDSDYSKREHNRGIGDFDRESYGLKIVNQYGLDVATHMNKPVTNRGNGQIPASSNKHLRPSQGNEHGFDLGNGQNTFSSNMQSSVYNHNASYNITKQIVQSPQSQQTAQTISQADSKYDGLKYSDTSNPAMSASVSVRSTNGKHNDQNRDTVNGGLTYPHDSEQELVALANRTRLRENQRIQNIALNTLDNSEAEIRATKGEAFRDRPVFDQGINGPSGILPYNGFGLQDVTTKTSNGIFAESQTGKATRTNSMAEFPGSQTRGQESTIHSSPSQSRGLNTNDNNRIPFQTGGKDFSRQKYSVRISNHENKQTDATAVHEPAKNLPKGKQINDSQIDGRTSESQLEAQTEHQTERDKFRNGSFYDWQKYDKNSWSNSPTMGNQTKRPEFVQPDKQPKEIPNRSRQQSNHHVQSGIYLSNGSNGLGHRIFLKDDVMNRTWSNSDDVFVSDDTKERINNFNSSSHSLPNGHSVYQSMDLRSNKNDSEPNGNDQSSRTIQQYSNPTKQYDASKGLGNTHLSSQTNPSLQHTKCSPTTEKSSRGALYHILSNKMNKQTPDSKEEPIYEVMTRPSNRHQNAQKPSVEDPKREISSASERSNSYPHEMSSTQKSMDKSQPISGKPNGLRRGAVNPHFYDASNTSKTVSYAPSKNGGLSNGFSNGNSQSNALSKPLQNTRNQQGNTPVNGFRPTGILKTTKNYAADQILYSASNQNSCAKKTDRVNLRDIISNRDATKEYSPSHSNGGIRVAMAANGKHYVNIAKTKIEDNNDSDTGLSSMHSDETTNMETLV